MCLQADLDLIVRREITRNCNLAAQLITSHFSDRIILAHIVVNMTLLLELYQQSTVIAFNILISKARDVFHTLS